MTGVLLQVRLGSTRLPGKALLRLAGRPVVEHAMLALGRLPVGVHAIVTDGSSAEILRPSARRCGFALFAGPEENVLERYVLAIRYFGLDEVIRATGDNPLVSWELARMAVALRRRSAADYAAFDGPPLGTGVEVVSANALERAHRSTTDEYDREHATPFLYRHPDEFEIVRVEAPPAYRLPDARVTLDTEEDYRRLEELYAALYDGSPVPVLALVNHLRSNTASRRSAHACSARS